MAKPNIPDNINPVYMIRIGDVAFPLSEWCEIFTADYDTIINRIHKQGYTPEGALYYEIRDTHHVDRKSIEWVDRCDFGAYVDAWEKRQADIKRKKLANEKCIYDVCYFYPVSSSAGYYKTERDCTAARLVKIRNQYRSVQILRTRKGARG